MTKETLHKAKGLLNIIEDLEAALSVVDQDYTGPIRAVTLFTGNFQYDGDLKELRAAIRTEIENKLKGLKEELESL